MSLERRFSALDGKKGGITGNVISYGDTAQFRGWKERFLPGSIHWPDAVYVNLQHDRGQPVANSRAGLTLHDDATALRATVDPPDTEIGRRARELVGAGLLTGFSLEFLAEDDEWQGDTRIIKRAELRGLALVDVPAYPDSSVAMRTRGHVPAADPEVENHLRMIEALGG